jgi:hypothetical protein
MFDYKGYSEEKLLYLTDTAYMGIAKRVFWSSEIYGINKSFRQYGFYPACLPLYVWCDHGVYTGGYIDHDYNTEASYMFVSSRPAQMDYKQHSKVPCYVSGAPLINYRRLNNINQVKNPRGTLIFPAHSCQMLVNLFSREELIEKIKALPEKFYPVCIMLHMWDIKRGDHKIYINAGIPVYTAGNNCDYHYGDRFYEVLRNFKYSMTNCTGSFLFYCIEMGIPCSMISERSKTLQTENAYDIKEGDVYDPHLSPVSEKANDLLRKSPPDQITDEMKAFVYEYAGINDRISRLKMAFLLYSAYFKQGDVISDFKNIIINFIVKILKRFRLLLMPLRKASLKIRYKNNPEKLLKKLKELL